MKQKNKFMESEIDWCVTREWNQEKPALVFDDQPLECLLYGQPGAEHTPVSMFSGARKLVDFVKEMNKKEDSQTVINLCKELAAEDLWLSVGMCFELIKMLSVFVPQIPNPVLRVNLTPLCPLLEKMRGIGLEKKDKALLEGMSTMAYRCFEHCGQYEKARDVLRWMLESSRQRGRRYNEAIALNNLAFEYLLEKRFKEALADFGEAANLFQILGSSAQSANSRANYWTCRFESSDIEDLDQAETELINLEVILTRSNSWQERKPLILLAKIAERRGDLKEGIGYVHKAIEACKGSGTRYPELDGNYLMRLKEKLQLLNNPCH